MKNINIIALVLNSLYLFYLIFEQILFITSFKSIGAIGIIGGADGPTAIYGIPSVFGLFQIILILFFEFVFIMNVRKQKQK